MWLWKRKMTVFNLGQAQCEVTVRSPICVAVSSKHSTHRRDMGPVWLLGSEDGEDAAIKSLLYQDF